MTLRLIAIILLACLVGCNGNKQEEQSSGDSDKTPSAVDHKIRVVLIPKKRGLEYFTACERGAREAEKELGDIELQFDGPVEDQPEKQAEIVESWIARRANVIGVACNDPTAIAPVLVRARKQGIHVITWDADATPESREFFINQATAEQIGTTLVDVMAREAGEDAKTAVITSTLEAPNQNAWIKEMRERIAEKYPRMEIVAIEQSKEEQQVASRATRDVLKSHPEVKGIFAITSVAFPGAADAVKQSGMKGQVAVTGLSTPKSMKQFVHDGIVKTVVLWSPIDLGYLTVHAARALVKGELKAGDPSLKAGRLGECKILGDNILLGNPKLFTRGNIDDFDF